MITDSIQIFVNNLKLISKYEIVLVILSLTISFIIGKFLTNLFKKIPKQAIISDFLRATASLVIPIITITILSISLLTLSFLNIKSVLTILLIKVVIAWFAISLVELLVIHRSVGWFLIILAIPITILSLFNLWQPCVTYLDNINFTIAKISLSVYKILKTLFIVIVLFKLTTFITHICEIRLKKLRRLKNSNKILILKIIQIAIYFVILLIALELLGINITTLAVFSGALGVGIGFGLQKITSNFISGIIILLEKSIEVDDLVELNDGTNGIVKRTGSRYILIETTQGKEVLVPNEDFITQRVINWTFTSNKCRIEIPISVSYTTDLELAKNIILEATKSCSLTTNNPGPDCYLREFGINSINFLLSFWIDDAIKGRYEPQSQVMFAIWKKFKEHGIEMPHQQMDIHVKSVPNKN